MQPYWLPYIGYFQLIKAVDTFVIYDNIEYTKKGWINRNRFLQNGKGVLFSLPIEKDSDFLTVKERVISDTFNKKKLLSQFSNAYRDSPFFKDTFPKIEEIINYNNNLFEFIYNSLKVLCKYLGINTNFVISSTIQMDHTLKAQEKVLEICKQIGTSQYINTIGGIDLYSKEEFNTKGIELSFIKPSQIIYKQFNNEFVPWLSIIDVMMFNSKKEIKEMLYKYELG